MSVSADRSQHLLTIYCNLNSFRDQEAINIKITHLFNITAYFCLQLLRVIRKISVHFLRSTDFAIASGTVSRMNIARFLKTKMALAWNKLLKQEVKTKKCRLQQHSKFHPNDNFDFLTTWHNIEFDNSIIWYPILFLLALTLFPKYSLYFCYLESYCLMSLYIWVHLVTFGKTTWNSRERSFLYNNQINARALIGQSAVGYCAGKPTEKARVVWIII